MKRVFYLMLALLLTIPTAINGQVTFGSLDEPHTFSVLELISNQKRGLRLSQMTSAQRDAISATSDFQANAATEAKGLAIFNTDINCVEYWNGTSWMNTCGEASPPAVGNVVISPTYNTYTDNTDLFTGAVLAGGTGDLKTRGTGVLYTNIGAGVFNYTDGEGQVLPKLKFAHSSGLTVIIPAQTLNGSPDNLAAGQITIQVSGIPTAAYAGKAFDIPVALFGKNLTVRVNTGCGVYTGDKMDTDEFGIATNWLQFQCYNLGASSNIDPLTANQYLHGAKYRFGANVASLAMEEDQNSANNTQVTGWNSKPIETGSNVDWSTEKNPCPAGWRLPTESVWETVISTGNNTQKQEGTWNEDAGNYTSGTKFGDALFLPATGERYYNDGGLRYRGIFGNYWSSSTFSETLASNFCLISDKSRMMISSRQYGFSVRCVAE